MSSLSLCTRASGVRSVTFFVGGGPQRGGPSPYTRGVRLGITIVVGLLLQTASALADPMIRWRAAPGCPDGSDALREIAQLMGDEFARQAPSVSLDVSLQTAAEGGFEARISLYRDGREQVRTLRDPRCSALARGVAVVAALLLGGDSTSQRAAATEPSADRTARVESSPGRRSTGHAGPSPTSRATGVSWGQGPLDQAAPQPAPEPAPPAAAPGESPRPHGPTPAKHARTAPAAHAPQSSRGREIPLTVLFGAGPGLLAGPLPSAAPSAAASLSLLLSHWEVSLGFSYAFARTTTLPDLDDIGGDVALPAGVVGAGYRFRLGRLDLPTLVGAELGRFVASGRGVEEGTRRRALWAAAQLSSGLFLRLPRHLAVGAALSGLLALQRPWFAVAFDDGTTRAFHHPSRWGLRAMIALHASFP